MRIAYLEGFSGVSGDMLLGAFLDAGVPADLLRETLAALNLGATLDIQSVNRSGISSTKVTVLVGDHPADAHGHHHHEHSHGHEHGHEHEHHEHAHERHHHGHDHHHEHEHEDHDHPHEHAEHRSLSAIRALIEGTALPKPVKATALRAFELLGTSEAKIHNVPIESIHFHEVGAVDSIADIVLAAAAAEALKVDAWHCSPLNVGGGTVQCAHGRFPVPAPATADLLRGVPTYSSGIEMELVTPTGAAIVRALGCQFGPAPAMRIDAIGYGAGTRDPHGFANVVRLCVGEAETAPETTGETVVVLETAIDDLNPQVVAHVTELALKAGALDVMTQPVRMKKNRHGTLLTLLANRGDVSKLEQLIFRETSTLGVRIREERRRCLDRTFVPVTTPFGQIRIKVGRWQGEEMNAAPEFEDCRAAAERHSAPLKRVIEAALQAYRKSQPTG
jgi:uncharacterized protein (TIGR00299 family) protein